MRVQIFPVFHNTGIRAIGVWMWGSSWSVCEGILGHYVTHFCLLSTAAADGCPASEIVVFRGSWTKFFLFLCYYTAWDGLKPTFRNCLLVPSKPLEMGERGNSGYSVSIYLTPRNNPEGWRIRFPCVFCHEHLSRFFQETLAHLCHKTLQHFR